MALAFQNGLALENAGFPGRAKLFKKYKTRSRAKKAGISAKEWSRITATAKRRGLTGRKAKSKAKAKSSSRRSAAKAPSTDAVVKAVLKALGITQSQAKAAAKKKGKAKSSRKGGIPSQLREWHAFRKSHPHIKDLKHLSHLFHSQKGREFLSPVGLYPGYGSVASQPPIYEDLSPSYSTYTAPSDWGLDAAVAAAPFSSWSDLRMGPTVAAPNGLALLNPLRVPSIGGIVRSVGGYVVGTAVPAVVVFYAMDKVVPLLQEKVYDPIADRVEAVPFIGSPVATALRAAPNAVTGALVGGALALPVIGRATSRLPLQAEMAIVTVAAVAPIIGFFMDWPSIKDAVTGGTQETLAGLALTNMGGLALENLGGLALENLGGLAAEHVPFGDALGDGMAYQTAPISAANYVQASLADAAYSGADFSIDEGQALLNGTFGAAYGIPPVRAAARKVGASHLAGRPGHRWGWLLQLVGPEKARQIAALPPRKRVKLIAQLRKAALQTFAAETGAQSLTDASDIALAHAATQASSQVGVLPAASAPGAPSGPSGAGSDLGAALFVGD